MKTHLAATFGITISVALGAAMGCGAEADPAGNGEATAVQSDALTGSPVGLVPPADVLRDYTVKRDLGRCGEAHCGGWLAEEVNAVRAPVHVDSLDLSRARLTAAGERELLAAPEEDILLRGAVGPVDSDGRRTLRVAEAFQGMPGFTRAPDDGFYGVSCLVSDCQSAMAYRIDTASHTEIEGVSVDRVLAPLVSGAWLLDRVENHGAVVAGHVAHALGANGAPDPVLEASQVFIRLPATSGPCPLILHFCPRELVPTYTRDAHLCLDFAGCARPGVCPLYEPACAEGYTRTQWAAGERACPAFACDPSFIDE